MASPNTKRKEDKSSNDLYTTPRIALDAIWTHLGEDVSVASNLLEPCAGMNDVTKYLTNKGALVFSNELYPCCNVRYDHTVDFLAENNGIGRYDLIITNPPYKLAKEFILKGFEHAPIQWHLLRLSFLEGQDRFSELFSLGKLSDVYIFSYRISCPKGEDYEPSPNSVCYAWYRFDKNYCGKPRLHWLTKPNLNKEK